MSILPVTVLAGSPTGDEAWLLSRLREGTTDRRITSIVPKGRSRSRQPGLLPTTERLVRLGEGCGCCTVRGDLLPKIRRIATESTADHVLVQAPQHTDLVTLAKTFTVADANGEVLSSVARLQTLVVVVDGDSLGANLDGHHARRLVERIELADTIVIRGGDADAQELLRALNPHARLLTETGELSLDGLQSAQPFDLPSAQRRASLSDILDQQEIPASEDGARFAFRAHRPFHPGRLDALLREGWGDILRASGAFWVATRPDIVGILHTIAGRSQISHGGRWWASVPPASRPQTPAFQQRVEESWHPAFGDRVQELAIVSLTGDEASLRERLTQCLITEEELREPDQWATWTDPFSWPE